jgi:hypothetical protein
MTAADDTPLELVEPMSLAEAIAAIAAMPEHISADLAESAIAMANATLAHALVTKSNH